MPKQKKPKKDWRKDPDANEKYCTCAWLADPAGDFWDSAVLMVHNPECPLHSDDPKFDLPEGI